MLGSNQIGGFEIWATISEDNRQCERLHILQQTTVFYETQGIPRRSQVSQQPPRPWVYSREVGDVGWSLQASDGLHPALEYTHQPFRDGSSESRAAVCLLKDEARARRAVEKRWKENTERSGANQHRSHSYNWYQIYQLMLHSLFSNSNLTVWL